MPGGGPGSHVEVTAAVTLVTVAETVIATINNGTGGPPPPLGFPYVPAALPAIISGVINPTGGTSTTAAQVRVRQNSLAGAVVGNVSTTPVTGAQAANCAFEALDPVGAPVYVVTCQLVSASANGSATGSVDCTPQ